MRVRNDLKRWLRGCVWVAGWACVVACSESHDVVGDGFPLTAGSSGSAPSASGGGGGTSGQPAGGAKIGKCTGCVGGNLLGILQVPACCTESSKCGLDLSAIGMTGCAEANAPGAVSTECPSQSIGGFLTFEGCCRPDKTCGALDNLLGLGCFLCDPTMAKSCTP
jgi:hypothetical protein